MGLSLGAALELRCDGWRNKRRVADCAGIAVFTGSTRKIAKRNAREAGWLVSGRITCPACLNAAKNPSPYKR